MILFFYTLKEYFRYVIGCIILTTFLGILFDFIHKSTNYMVKHQPKTIHIVQYYLFSSPGLILQSLPIAALLSSVVCMVLLSRSNEVTAMRAAGMGPLAIGLPIGVGGFILTIAAFFVSEWVVPRSAMRLRYVDEVLIRGESAIQAAEGSRWFRDQDRFVYVGQFDPLTLTLRNVKILEVDENFHPTALTDAPKGFYRTDSKDWEFSSVKETYLSNEGKITGLAVFDSRGITLPLDPKKLRKDRRKPNELSVFELNDLIARGNKAGIAVAEYLVEMHIKIAYAFATLLVSLIGIKFAFRSERSLEPAKSVLGAILVGLTYWIVLYSSRALARTGDANPMLSAWTANLVIFTINVVQIWRARKV